MMADQLNVNAELFRFVGLRGIPTKPEQHAEPFVIRTNVAANLDAIIPAEGPVRELVEFLEGHAWCVDPRILRDHALKLAGVGNVQVFLRQEPVVAHRTAAEAVLTRVAGAPSRDDGGDADAAAAALVALALLKHVDERLKLPRATITASDVAAFVARSVIVLPEGVGETPLAIKGAEPRRAITRRALSAAADDPDRKRLASVRAAVEALAHTAATDEKPVLSEEAIARIREITTAQWDPDGIFLSLGLPIEEVIERLELEARRTAHQLWARRVNTDGFPPLLVVPPPTEDLEPREAPASVPVKLGVGDLLVARVTKTDYVYGEIAHIENVMATEHRQRTHRRRDVVERELLSEAESETVAEQDNQSTQRFELEKESSRTLNEELKIEAGANISSSFGPVTASASFGLSSSSSRATADQQSSKFAQEITTKASQKVRTSTRTQERTTTLTEIIETGTHGFDNRGAAAKHRSGIYRWVDRIETIQLENYGQRLMIGMTLPEPGSFLRWRRAREAATHTPPEPLTVMRNGVPVPLSPLDITIDNYLVWAARVGTSVDPPPRRYRSDTQTFQHDPSVSAESPGFVTQANATVQVPAGYRVIRIRGALINYTLSVGFPGLPASAMAVPETTLTAGQQELARIKVPAGSTNAVPVFFDKGVGQQWPLVGTKAEAKIPVMLHAATSNGYAASVEFVFERTQDALSAWQAKVFDALVDAHDAAVRSWESERRNANLATINFGESPERKRQIERTELKRLCTAVLAGVDSGVDAIVDAGDHLPPTIDRSALGNLSEDVDQCEEPFEWNHMSWRCLDYHYAERASWAALSTESDPDEDHRAFLAAGAATVTLPVRPGHETLVLFRLWFGAPWPGHKAPLPGGLGGLGIAGELAGAPQVPQQGVAVPGAVWTERLPTGLVILQPNSTLFWDAAKASRAGLTAEADAGAGDGDGG